MTTDTPWQSRSKVKSDIFEAKEYATETSVLNQLAKFIFHLLEHPIKTVLIFVVGIYVDF